MEKEQEKNTEIVPRPPDIPVPAEPEPVHPPLPEKPPDGWRKHDYLPGEDVAVDRLLAIYKTAMLRKYPISRSRRKKLVRQCNELMTYGATEDIRMRAMAVLLAADRNNVSREQIALKAAEALHGGGKQDAPTTGATTVNFIVVGASPAPPSRLPDGASADPQAPALTSPTASQPKRP